jgi:hypothetical protein
MTMQAFGPQSGPLMVGCVMLVFTAAFTVMHFRRQS